MGIHNRTRRRQKQTRRARQERLRQGAPGGGPRPDGDRRALLTHLVWTAAEQVHHGDPKAPELLELLAAGPLGPGDRGLVAEATREGLDEAVVALRRARWRPEEIARVARRRRGPRAQGIVTARIRAVAQATDQHGHRGGDDDAWIAEAAALPEAAFVLEPQLASWSKDLSDAVGLLGALSHLPELPPTTRRRHRAGSDQEARMLEKVRALLAKAESTSFPEEAAILTAKAQELLSRHCLDAAALKAPESEHHGTYGACLRRIWIDEPYLGPKSLLVHVVAEANRCRCVSNDDLGLVTVAGHEDDLEVVELLLTSLLLQATTQMAAAGRRADGRGRSRTRSFRQSFLVGFATRIGQRLEEAARTGVAEGLAEHGNRLLPVLASREATAQATIDELFPHLVNRQMAVGNEEGWRHGRAAAELASLSVQPELAGFAIE